MCQQLSSNKFVCPICGSLTAELLPVGSPYPILSELEVIGAGARMQKCSFCGSTDRDRLVYLYLRDYYSLFNSKSAHIKVLHVAPEKMLANKIMSIEGLTYIPIDSFEQGYIYPEYIIKMDLQQLNLEDNDIDLIICNHVLQDIKDDCRAMSEIFRVMKPSGEAILQVPISPKIEKILEHIGDKDEDYCINKYGQRFHKRIYSRNGYIDRLSSIGFRVTTLNLEVKYPYHSLNPQEVIFKVTKNDTTSK